MDKEKTSILKSCHFSDTAVLWGHRNVSPQAPLRRAAPPPPQPGGETHPQCPRLPGAPIPSQHLLRGHRKQPPDGLFVVWAPSGVWLQRAPANRHKNKGTLAITSPI